VLCVIGRFTTVVALCFAIGLQWIALQSVAWTTMMIQNAKQASFCEAVKRTFDGNHPCSLCHVVNKGKSSEQKRDAQSPTPRVDMISVARLVTVLPLAIPFQYELLDCVSFALEHSPPVPPPRYVS
jgi:hypothetical protein